MSGATVVRPRLCVSPSEGAQPQPAASETEGAQRGEWREGCVSGEKGVCVERRVCEWTGRFGAASALRPTPSRLFSRLLARPRMRSEVRPASPATELILLRPRCSSSSPKRNCGGSSSDSGIVNNRSILIVVVGTGAGGGRGERPDVRRVCGGCGELLAGFCLASGGASVRARAGAQPAHADAAPGMRNTRVGESERDSRDPDRCRRHRSGGDGSGGEGSPALGWAGLRTSYTLRSGTARILFEPSSRRRSAGRPPSPSISQMTLLAR